MAGVGGPRSLDVGALGPAPSLPAGAWSETRAQGLESWPGGGLRLIDFQSLPGD